MTVAHSAPVYVVVDGQPFWKADAVAGIVAEQKSRLAELMTADVDPRGDLEPWETYALMQQEWPEQRRALQARVDEASARYQRLAERAAGATSAPRAPLALVVLVAALFMAARHGPARKR
jgi:hypothetical protein